MTESNNQQTNSEKEETAMKKNGKRKWLIGGGSIIAIILLILCLRSCGNNDVPAPEPTPTPSPTITDDNNTNVDDVSEMVMYLNGKAYNYVKYGEEFVDEGVRICEAGDVKVEYPDELSKVWTKVDVVDSDGKSHEVTKERQESKCEIDTTQPGKYIITYTYKGENGDQAVTRIVTVGANPDAGDDQNSSENTEKPGTTSKPSEQNPDPNKKDDTQQQPSDEDENSSNTTDISGVVFEGKTVTYDKTEHHLEATNVPNGVRVEYHNNYKTEAGKYLVTAVLYDSNANVIGRLQAWLEIKKASPNMSAKGIFESKEFKYDGQIHYLSVNESKLPSEVFVDHYENNGRSAIGSQWVTVYFGVYDTRNYEVPTSMRAKLTIKDGGGSGDEDPDPVVKKDIDMSGLQFEGLEWVYDKKSHSVTVVKRSIPKGITNIRYEGNGQTEAGTYDVKIYFTVDESKYNPVDPIIVKMTIKKADPDMSNVLFPDRSYKYDGWEYSCYVDETTLPPEVFVDHYEGNKQSVPGTYTVKAFFGVNDPKNYNVPKPMTATLKIIKDSNPNKEDIDMTGVRFEGLEHTYDGTKKFVNIVNSTLPPEVTVLRVTGNGKVDAGTYDVWFYFSVDTNKYNSIDPIKVTMKIKKASPDMSKTVFKDQTFEYDGKEHFM